MLDKTQSDSNLPFLSDPCELTIAQKQFYISYYMYIYLTAKQPLLFYHYSKKWMVIRLFSWSLSL